MSHMIVSFLGSCSSALCFLILAGICISLCFYQAAWRLGGEFFEKYMVRLTSLSLGALGGRLSRL